MYTKGLKRSQCAIPVTNLTPNNARLIDVAHHALQISSALLKVVKIGLTDEEKKLVPTKVSATKQKILDLTECMDDDDIMVRLEKGCKGQRKYEFFRVPYYQFKAARDNCAYHEIISKNNVRFFCDIDHSTAELFTKFLQVT